MIHQILVIHKDFANFYLLGRRLTMENIELKLFFNIFDTTIHFIVNSEPNNIKCQHGLTGFKSYGRCACEDHKGLRRIAQFLTST